MHNGTTILAWKKRRRQHLVVSKWINKINAAVSFVWIRQIYVPCSALHINGMYKANLTDQIYNEKCNKTIMKWLIKLEVSIFQMQSVAKPTSHRSLIKHATHNKYTGKSTFLHFIVKTLPTPGLLVSLYKIYVTDLQLRVIEKTKNVKLSPL